MKRFLLKRLFPLVLAILLVCTGVLLYQHMTSTNKKSESEYISKAQAMLDVEKYETAEEISSEGLKLYPNNVQLYIIKIQSFAFRENYDMALRTIDYAYKQTKSDSIEELKEQYSRYFDYEDDAKYLPPSENSTVNIPQSESSGWNSGNNTEYSKKKNEKYVAPEFSEITLPEVSFPESSAEESSQGNEQSAEISKPQS